MVDCYENIYDRSIETPDDILKDDMLGTEKLEWSGYSMVKNFCVKETRDLEMWVWGCSKSLKMAQFHM